MFAENAPGGWNSQWMCITATWSFSTVDSDLERYAGTASSGGSARKYLPKNNPHRHHGGRAGCPVEIIWRDRIEKYKTVRAATHAIGCDTSTVKRALKSGRITARGFMARYV